MTANISYPAVCLKLYNELLSQMRWKEALSLIDKAPDLTRDKRDYLNTPNWIEMKYELLKQHGSR